MRETVTIFSSLRNLWYEPRRSSFRLWMFRLHQWAGVGIGLYLALMGLTGGMSVFLPELRNTLVAPIDATAGLHRLSLQALQSRIEQSYPNLLLRTVYPGRNAVEPDTFEEQAADKALREIVIDPYSGHILADRKKGATIYDWVRNLHANLLSGKAGKTLNGFGGILLMLTGLTGIVIWWPGGRHVKASTFQISTRKGLHRLSFDLHRLAGILILLPLSVAAITGIGLAFPQLTGITVSSVLGPRSEPLRSKGDQAHGQDARAEKTQRVVRGKAATGKVDANSSKIASLDDVVEVAKMQVRGAGPGRIDALPGKNGGFVVWMHLPNDWRDEGDNRVLVDGHSAKLLGVQLGRRLTWSSRVIAGMTAVHYGQYGGISTRIFAGIVGLALPLLYVSGMVVWWRRISRERCKTTVVGATSVVTAGDSIHAIETQ